MAEAVLQLPLPVRRERAGVRAAFSVPCGEEPSPCLLPSEWERVWKLPLAGHRFSFLFRRQHLEDAGDQLWQPLPRDGRDSQNLWANLFGELFVDGGRFG